MFVSLMERASGERDGAHRCPAHRVAFIPFICAGDPNLEATGKALQKLDAIGADVIELGVPYSVSQRGRVAAERESSRVVRRGKGRRAA